MMTEPETDRGPAPPPRIFSPRRRLAARSRAQRMALRDGAARWLLDDMVDDVIDRLGFVRHHPARALVVGDRHGDLTLALRAGGAEVIRADPVPSPGETSLDEERPWLAQLGMAQLGMASHGGAGFDLIVSLATLDTVNDLPGALIHARHALASGGLFIASFVGAGSLPSLREAMFAADGERPAARMHPMVDVRAGAQLLQRTGFADPVADGRTLSVRYAGFSGLIDDLRAQGLTGVLTSSAPILGKAGRMRAEACFTISADPDGRVTEKVEILTLSGWKR